MGIETYPSPSIGPNRNSNLSSCFREEFGSLSIADNRGKRQFLTDILGSGALKELLSIRVPY